MKTKTLKITVNTASLIGRGLASWGGFMHNSVLCVGIMGRGHLQSAFSTAASIRAAVRDLGPSNRAWAISWLRLGVKIHRDSERART
jgi:hypothetical protein